MHMYILLTAVQHTHLYQC